MREPRSRRGVQFAISTLVLGVLVVGAMLGLQIKTNWSLGESFCGVLFFLMGAFFTADVTNWAIRMSRPSEKPKRPWFRVHLLTSVLMMLTAATFVGLNSYPSFDLIRLDSEYADPVSLEDAMSMNEVVKEAYKWDHAGLLHIRRYGWPCRFWEVNNRVYAQDWKWRDAGPSNLDLSTWAYNGQTHLFYDLATLLGLVAITAFLSEFLLRRREGRQP